MMALNTISQAVPTMSSREIAVTFNSTHDNVLKTIRRLISEGVVFGNETPYINAQNGQTYSEFMLSFRDTMVVASGYSAEMRAKIIDRWQALENAKPKFDPAILSRMDILKLAMESEEGRIKAEAERDQAIATKALIGSKREATAMATASVAKRQVARLQDQLGVNTRHATITAVENSTGREYPWNPLKKWCKANCVSVVKVADPRFGAVNAWPRAAWMDVYGIDLAELFGQHGVQ